MQETILYIAVSIDGYIATETGAIDWLDLDRVPFAPSSQYTQFYDTIGAVVMGNKTYKQITTELAVDNYPYKDVQSYIFTHQPTTNTDSMTFLNEQVDVALPKIQEATEGNIWIVGGNGVIQPLIEKNLIDTYIITVIPVFLGRGIPLFESFDSDRYEYIMKATTLENGMVTYTFKK
ncbi:dihydrofolate reductase family protein [Erysipelothrix aquatica]|uniref:dihydrofolate reductase family protein n=1 Tax=Erysipelothrix aquatica TaxID=2683714 RepID=UPI001356886F|nr:dihydrofolate reductase family protein [Erysipelothrix aquatica]